MNKDTHVYCTNCIYGKNLIQTIINEADIPEQCKNCYPDNPEDSIRYKDRPNYNEKVKQWFH